MDQETHEKVTKKTQETITQESQGASPFRAGEYMARRNRHKGSYMSAHAFIKRVGERDEMRGLPINEFNKFNNTRA